MRHASKRFLAALFAAQMGVAAAVAGSPATFGVDPVHTTVSFRIRHIVTRVTGRFTECTGSIIGDPSDPAGARIELTIKASTIDTQNADRDKHLRSADFFDVQEYPEITFKSTKIIPKGGDAYDVVGTFSMRGVTKEITVPVVFNGVVKDPWGMERAGFDVTYTLNRKDYGLNWNKALDQGGFVLGDDVEISIGVEAVKKAPEAKS